MSELIDVKQFGKVAVVCGGWSAEREVSLTSGKAVLDALLAKGVDAHHFDPKETDISKLRDYDRVFNVLHGTFGEDGSLQGVLDGFNIPYTGCGVLASAIAMDKFRNRLVWQALDLPNVPYVVLDDNTDFTAIEQQLGLPLFVKPAAEGSSVGVFKIKQAGELPRPTHSSNNTTALFWQKKPSQAVSMLALSSVMKYYPVFASSQRPNFMTTKPNTIVMIPSTNAHQI